MATSDNDPYRLVPYRFFINDSKTTICKLEKLTNLFPELKLIIELELFKINNLSKMIDRLSEVYSVLTFVDNRDDTCHLFLGPYHLALGPAIFGALHFKNVSAALMASSTTKIKSDIHHHNRNRRREAVLRRFRRAVRKLIFIKSIINQIRIASILTPYNQYELYRHGIYDLALSGHVHQSNLIFDDENFIQQVDHARSIIGTDKENPLFSSKFIKINSLLNLLASTTTHHPQDSNSIVDHISQSRSRSNTINSYPTNDDNSNSFLKSTSICCTQHNTNQQNVVIPVNRTTISYSNQLLSHETHSKSNSHQNSRSNSLISVAQNLTGSLPDLTSNEILTSKSNDTATTTSKTSFSSSSSSMISHEEDILIDRISSLLIDHLSSQQSTTNQSSLTVHTDLLNHLLEHIKTVVNNNLSVKMSNNDSISETISNEENLSFGPINKTITKHRRRKLFASRTGSLQETAIYEFDVENPSEFLNNKHKLELLSKSQSFDETNLNNEEI